MILTDLIKNQLIYPPDFIECNTHYLTITGSVAYECADTNTKSDIDLYGFCIPPKNIIFPHLDNEIIGFGRQKKKFEQFQADHIPYREKEYDINVLNIVKYFSLLMDCNPNIIDTIFTKTNYVVHCTQIGNLVRENRRLFLHKGAYHRFKGYAFSQLHKMSTKDPSGKRKEIRDKFGFDVKFGMHVVRLVGECEQILSERDLDLTKNNEQLKAIRRGEYSETQIRNWFANKENSLENLYNSSKIPMYPDEDKIKDLLLKCLEIHYGSLEKCVFDTDKYLNALKEIKEVLHNVRV